jgi:tetratricopeptide (TPR) repeat protein
MTTRLLRAEIAATKALSLAPDNAHAHYVLAGVLCVTNRAEQAIAECERALAIDPNWAGAHAVIGLSNVLAGRAEETEAHIQKALRLSPRDPGAFYWLWHLGAANILLARYEEAIAWLRRSIEANRNNPMSHFHLAAALALVGRLEEARAAAAAGFALIPQFTIARLYRARLFSNDPAYLAGLKLIAEALAKAGVPEE